MPEADLLRIRRTVVAGVPRLELRGEVDAFTASELKRCVAAELQAASSTLVLDFTHLLFIDGSGLRVLEWAAEAFAPRPIEILNADAMVRELATLTGLDSRVAFVPATISGAERMTFRRIGSTGTA